jgi:hypothetical protein
VAARVAAGAMVEGASQLGIHIALCSLSSDGGLSDSEGMKHMAVSRNTYRVAPAGGPAGGASPSKGFQGSRAYQGRRRYGRLQVRADGSDVGLQATIMSNVAPASGLSPLACRLSLSPLPSPSPHPAPPAI